MRTAEVLPLSHPPPPHDRNHRSSAAVLALVLGLVAWAAWPALRLDFWNSDDWFHIEVAAGMLRGDGAAFSRAWWGHVPDDALRLVPYLLWVADYALFGLKPAGYYATNLLVHLGTVAAVFVLARRLSGAVAPAVAAAALFGLNAATTQPLYFLAARQDAMAVLLCAGTAAAWPELRRSGRGIAVASVLYLMACFCKLPAAALPAGLLALEALERRREPDSSPSWRALGLGFGSAAAVYLVALLVTVDVPGLLGRVAGPGELAPWPMIGRRFSALVTPAGAAADAGLLWPDALVLAAVAVATVAALLLRRPGWPLLAVGAAWLVACMPAPAPWLLREALPEDPGGRYLLLPAVGASLVFAGLLPAGSDRSGRVTAGLAAAAILAGSVAGFVLSGRPMMLHNDSRPSLLLETLAADLDAPNPAERLVMAVQRPDRGTLALLASGVLRLRFPALEEAPQVFLQGRSTAMSPTQTPYEYGGYLPGPPIALDSVGPEVLVVSDEHRAVGEGWSVSWRAWRGAGVPPAQSDATPPESFRWDFRQLKLAWSAEGQPWSAGSWRRGTGWVLRPRRALSARSLPHVLVGSPERRPALLRSGPIDIPQGAVCGLVLDLTSPVYEPKPLDEGLIGGPFALLTWSDDPELPDPFARMLVLPLAGGSEQLEVDLRNAPAWRATGRVRRLGLSAAGVDGTLELRWIRPLPCP